MALILDVAAFESFLDKAQQEKCRIDAIVTQLLIVKRLLDTDLDGNNSTNDIDPPAIINLDNSKKRRCKACKEVKPLSSFPKWGTHGYKHKCRNCMGK